MPMEKCCIHGDSRLTCHGDGGGYENDNRFYEQIAYRYLFDADHRPSLGKIGRS